MNSISQVANSSGISYQLGTVNRLSDSKAEAERRVHETQEAAKEAGVNLFPSQREFAHPYFNGDLKANTEAIKAAEREVHKTQAAAREAGINLFPTPKKLIYPSFTGQFKFGRD